MEWERADNEARRDDANMGLRDAVVKAAESLVKNHYPTELGEGAYGEISAVYRAVEALQATRGKP